MAVRLTIERLLRDSDDASGQSIRDWKIECEGGHAMIRLKHGSGFLLMRLDDVDLFIGDLQRARNAVRSLGEEE